MTLVRLARELGYETVLVDARPAFATAERFPDVDHLLLAWPDEAAETLDLGPADAVAILSHDPKSTSRPSPRPCAGAVAMSAPSAAGAPSRHAASASAQRASATTPG